MQQFARDPSRVRRLGVFSCLVVGAMLIASSAWAAGDVTVNFGALDALSGGASAPAVTLRAPSKPAAAAAPSIPKPQTAARQPAKPARAMAAAPAPSTPAQPVEPKMAMAAARSAAAALAPGRVSTLRYAKDQEEVPAESRAALDALATRLASDQTTRLQLVAYASGSNDDPTDARRMALKRAVDMRAYLIGKGVSSARIDVRALGDRDVGDGPPDRVDIVAVER